MITQRFRPLVWVAGVAFAATALYTVSLGVASERAKLEDLNKKIADTRREIRQLQTELGTRGSLRQLERWNGEAVSLVAPNAKQYLGGDSQLSLVKGEDFAVATYESAPVLVEASEAGGAKSTEAESEKPLVTRSPSNASGELAKLNAPKLPKLSAVPSEANSKNSKDKGAPTP